MNTTRITRKPILFLISLIIGLVMYFGFLINMLPLFFANMESIEKNMLALVIVIASIYILLKMIVHVNSKADVYILVILYMFVLFLGLLRPDQIGAGERIYSFNPIGFISDMQENRLSKTVFVINIVMFMPMYFLLAKMNLFKKLIPNILLFEVLCFSIECLQFYFKKGVFDLSDILLYNIGFFIGYFVVLPLFKNKNSKGR